ncbi:hypothetical protein ACOMHN_060692 [Nucella lapillus]
MLSQKANLSIFSLLLFLTLSTGNNRNEFIRNRPRRANSLSNLQTLVEDQASVIHSLQSELAATQDKIDDLETQLGSRLEALESSDQGHKDQFAVLSDKFSKSVAFTVRFSNDPITDVGQHSILKFDNVQFNLGNAFSPQSGIFTAPESGVYAFHLSLMGSWQWSELSLVKNGAVIDSVHVNDDSFDQGSLFETVHLNAGELVWVQPGR